MALNKKKWIRLKYASTIIRLVEIVKDEDGNDVELKCEIDVEGECNKPKGNIHWVADPVEVEIREYDRLFTHENPSSLGSEWLTAINPNSLTIVNALADRSVIGLKEFDKVQFERHGYYSVDPDSTKDNLVFNKAVSLKDSYKKK